MNKKIIYIKFLEYRKNGLIKYGKYLEDQLKMSQRKKSQTSYKSYLESEIKKNNDRITKILNKLS